MRISIELVPRTAAQLLVDAGRVVARYPRIATLNLPDAARFELDSVAAAARLHGIVTHRIPHLRARAFTAATAELLIERLATAHVREAIVVAGDERNGTAAHWPFTPVELIRFLRAHAPWLATYAALDPHRLSGDALVANVDAKRAAGVTGFFSQPLYELGDLDRCSPLLGSAPVFWGLSPVTTLRTQRYWEKVNGVRFPADFEPTLAWSHTFGRRVMREVAARGHHLYLMPITVDVAAYLDGFALAA